MRGRRRRGELVEQAGAIAFRVREGKLQVLLVSPKDEPDTRIFPKGHVEPGERAADAAVRELEEEAGVHGTVVDIVCPPLRIHSRGESIEVQYFVVAAGAESGPREGRERQWVDGEQVGDRLTHGDARRLFARALPLIRSAPQDPYVSENALGAELQALLLAEYQHTADSLLRNEEDGERRVRFFLSLAGAAAGIVVLVRGDAPAAIRPEVIDPALILLVALLGMIGYITFVRVVERNMASDRYKRGLNRIRRAFVPSARHRGVAYLAFDPYAVVCRKQPDWLSFGRGGWLETVAMVEAVLLGGLAALVVPARSWWLEAAVAAAVAALTWVALIARAKFLYWRSTG